MHTQEISNHVAILAKQKRVRKIIRIFQKKIIKKYPRICCEGRDQASTILNKNPRYDIAFYFKCNLDVASFRRWRDLKKKIPLKEVKKSLKNRTLLDKKIRRLVETDIRYVGFDVPDEFLVGYGLDYQEKYRNLPFIGVLKP